MTVLIRRATAHDAADVARIHVQSWQETYHGMMPQSFLDALDVTQRTQRWKQHLQNPAAFPMFVALIDDQVCGIAGAGERRPPSDDDGNAAAAQPYDSEIYLIYVLKGAQGKDLGRKLMRAMSASLSAIGLKRPMLWVAAENRSSQFYEHLGGKEFARKTEVIAGADLEEIGYGWQHMSAI